MLCVSDIGLNFTCRLGENMTVKVADFGFSENLYTTAYVRTALDGGVKLPVKWMAPESLLDGVFSEKTDVVWLLPLLLYITFFTYHAFSISFTKISYNQPIWHALLASLASPGLPLQTQRSTQ